MGWTILHEAALKGNVSLLKILHKLGANANIADKEDRTPLHIAAAAGHTNIAHLLIEKFDGSVRARTRDGSTLLHVAALSGHASTALAFLKHGVPLCMPNKRGALGLHCAAAAGFTDVVQLLIARGTNVDIKTRDNYTALHVAVQAGKASVVEALLGYGADVHVHGGAIGETALHIAASLTTDDAIECAIMLLKSGAQTNVTRNDGETPLHIAARNPLSGMIRLLLNEGAESKICSNSGESVLHVAAKSCNSEAVVLILEHLSQQMSPEEIKEFVNARTTQDGLTAVHYAAQITSDQIHFPGEDAKLIKTLIDYDGQPELQTYKDQETAMHLAARSGNEAALLAIVDKIGAGAVQIVQNKQTKNGWSPLMEACALGHFGVAKILLEHHARVDVFDENGRTALHLAAANGHLKLTQLLLTSKAFNDYPAVVKLFLKMRQNNRAVLTAIDLNGSTCAHIAAVKGSYAVVKELMMIDKAMVIQAKTKTMEATALHMAAAGGHDKIVKFLLENGANAENENAHGMTALHLGAKNGFVPILNVFDHSLWKKCSKKTGLNALHIAAYYGNSDFVMEMLKHVPASLRSEPPIYNHYVVKEFATEYGFTPLHLAAQSGHDSLVRMLLNQGVQVDATSTTMSVIPLHLAAQQGHIAVVGMLLSRSTQQQHAKDWRGRTPLHLAAMNGHYEMVSLLIAQGSNINVMDQNGWTGMHYATQAGHLNVIKLFVKSSADAQAETKEGKVPLCFAAAHNHVDCLRFLLKQNHDTHALMDDRKFIFDLMVCGKTNDNEPLKEFILQSPAPIDTAVKLSSLYHEMSEKEKERAKDLLNVSQFAEDMAVELLGITASEYNPALLLKAKDNRGRPLLDVLIENEQKEVVSYASVQRYLTEVWTGRVEWSFGKTVAFTLMVLICPPAWFYFSLPLDTRIGRAPIIKFVCHIVSHIYFTILLTIVVLSLTHKIYEVRSIMPNPVEWLLLLWLSGNLVSELSNVGGGGSGLGIVKPAYQPADSDDAQWMRLSSPEQTLEMLFFSLFGLVEPDTMPPLHLVPDFGKIILKMIFGIYLLVTLIVLINLLIAMMSDTYQRIQAQSDKEWKFGRAILIRQMNKRAATPAPINMLTKLIVVLKVAYRNNLKLCTQKAQQDLRHEENIDAFSMSGDTGRLSPAILADDDTGEVRRGQNEELGKSDDWNIETIIDWKRVVDMYYQTNGQVDAEDIQVEMSS
ncbi:hypothetical protein LOAG_18270 [Loa loa]|uniref:Uncharacterized protein n=1 Tax=Loa loa TaxID=7209 RepID=A0A1S0UFQ9_LOALO|nr:hypothetical protein LOAG_18270 [Loa loa]EJD74415.1 hypothetical protein LOAG_18270 [Loa loa]